MNYKRFEALRVWQGSIDLAVRVFALTARSNFRGYGGLKNQIEQAVVSISNNIAEGFERGTTPELLTFLNVSRGSSGETRSLLCLIDCLPGFEDLGSEISDLRSRAESISRQLNAWADSIQSSETIGQQYSTDKGRRATREARDRYEFLKEKELEGIKARHV